MKITTYGEGGYDPTQTNDNIVEEREIDDPAGFGLAEMLEAQAVVVAARDPEQPTPSLEARLAALEALVVPPTGEDPETK